MQFINRRSRRRRTMRRQRRGATLVEFSIVAPLFFLILVASVEFSRVNVMRHSADHAAYEAARAAMVPGATAADAVDIANDVLRIVGARGANVEIFPPVIDETVGQITVNIDIPLDQNTFVFPKFTQSRSIAATSTLKTERVRALGG